MYSQHTHTFHLINVHNILVNCLLLNNVIIGILQDHIYDLIMCNLEPCKNGSQNLFSSQIVFCE